MVDQASALNQTAAAHLPRRMSWAWIGVTPFFAFALLFLILPSGYLIVGAFLDPEGHFTFANILELQRPILLKAYWNSILLSAATAAGGAIIGFMVAYAVVLGGLPRWLRPLVTTFSGVASQFAGIPLAFAFIATLGPTGLVTAFLVQQLGIDLRGAGFSLFSFLGLTLTYMYFQIPLMVLILMPALDGLKREWREASEILGADGWQYWRYVAFPILWPGVLGASFLLFANAFGAVATAFALMGPQLNLATIQLYAQIRGDALHNENLGFALAVGMIVITGVSNAAYIFLRGRSERWVR